MRPRLVLGNWKMNGCYEENEQLLQRLNQNLMQETLKDGLTIAVCVPFVYLQQTSGLLADSVIKCGVQDISVHSKGAYTGEVSGAMLKELACSYVLVGHSERRQYHQESSALVAKKVEAALKSDILPVLCVGETLDQRNSGDTMMVVDEQLEAVKSLVSEDALSRLVIAYEPVWAIGTGLTATPEQAQEVHQYIRQLLGSANRTPIVYGGSVKADNAANLFAQDDVDGALVGGASLDAQQFTHIIQAANS